MTPAHAVIIAGGQGQRLGGARKADIRIGGITMLERVADALTSAARPVIVATGPHGASLALGPDYIGVSDLDSNGGGPLAGLAAAVASLRSRGITKGALVSVAVDTPFLPADYTQRLLAALTTAPSAFAAWGDGFYPPNAAWRLEAIADLPERASAYGSLKALHQSLGGARVAWDDAADNPFDNLNTLQDLVALQKRANRLARL